jgi:hypothetical protein
MKWLIKLFGISAGILIILFIAVLLIPQKDAPSGSYDINGNSIVNNDNSLVLTFEDCVDAGNPVMESYPRQCRHNGDLFVENIEATIAFEEGVILTYPKDWKTEDTFVGDNTESKVGEMKSNILYAEDFPVSEIKIKRYELVDGVSFEEIVTTNSFNSPKGTNPEFFEFEVVKVGERTFHRYLSEYFEGQLVWDYYLINEGFVYKFQLIARGVPLPFDSPNGEDEAELNENHVQMKEILGTLVFKRDIEVEE